MPTIPICATFAPAFPDGFADAELSTLVVLLVIDGVPVITVALVTFPTAVGTRVAVVVVNGIDKDAPPVELDKVLVAGADDTPLGP
jgi:hypothetical protein